MQIFVYVHVGLVSHTAIDIYVINAQWWAKIQTLKCLNDYQT